MLQTGFPFDKDFQRADSERPFRSRLDDIAQRHPEFAEHLTSFNRDLPRARSRFAEAGDDPFEEFVRRAERPFGSPRFERFTRRFEDEPPVKQPNQTQPQPTQQQPPPEPKQEPAAPEKKPLVQSNTVDLGQKQEPVDDQRGQRSMSAPPENRNTQQRFVSSCNIPVNVEKKGEGEGQQSAPQSRGGERVIPIFVEGRDVPVVPKNVHPTFEQPHTAPPQPERIFGQKPSHFTQFLNRGEPGFAQQQPFSKPQQPAQPKAQQAPPKPQPQQKPETPPPQQEKPPQQPSQKPTPTEVIQAIQKDVSQLMDQVEKFTGQYKDKQYLYLDEMLTRNLIKLDNIDTEGKENIRQARKEAIKCIQQCISILEAKANSNNPEQQQMEVEPAQEEKPQDLESQQVDSTMETEPINTLEVSGVVKSGTQANVAEEAPKVETPMEVASEQSQEAKPEEVNTETRAVLVTDTKPAETEEKKDEKEKKKGKKKDKSEKK